MTTPRHEPRSDAHPATRRRSGRVGRLLLAVVVLSGVDLVLTHAFMSTVGMSEANPLAAGLVRLTGSTLGIALLKATTVLVAVSVLYRLRFSLPAEVGAWFATLILTALTVQWVLYAGEMSALDLTTLDQIRQIDPNWIRVRELG